jgi:GntR family transcriptional regulator
MMSIAFELPVGQPMFRATSNVFSVTGVPIMHDISYYRSDEHVFSNTLVRSQH